MKALIVLFCTALTASGLVKAEAVLQLTVPNHGPTTSIGIETLRTAYQKLDISVEFIEMPLKRALRQSNEGKMDGEIFRVWEIGESYPNLIRVPTPIYQITQQIYSSKHQVKITACADFEGYTVGIVRGLKHAENCAKHASKVKLYNTNQQMMEVLNAGRLDFVISSERDGLWLKNATNMENIFVLEDSLAELPLYHYLHKKNAHLVEPINAIFVEMIQSGEFEAISKRINYSGEE